MKNYELTYLISPELSEEEARAFQEKIISLIKEKGGVLNEANSPIKKRLAYQIKKQGQAYLAILNFQLNPEELAGLEKKIKLENKILRYLILTKKVTKIIPKAVRVRPVTKKLKETVSEKEKKVELKEIEKKLEEILSESQ